MGPGRGFYILRPHTAAFSKQSTIIRSDKRANTEHSRVKIKPPPFLLLSPHLYPVPPHPASSRCCDSSLVFAPPFLPNTVTGSISRGGVTFDTRSNPSLSAFLTKRPMEEGGLLSFNETAQKRGYFIRSYCTWITHLRCVSSGFFSDFLRTNEQGDSPL